MKILIVSLWYKPHVGGVVETMDNLASGLRKKGHEVSFLIEGPENQIVLSGQDHGSPIYSFRIRDFAFGSIRSMIAAALMYYPTVRKLSRFFREHRFDIVNVHYPTSRHVHFLPLKNSSFKKLVVSVHGSDVRLGLGNGGKGRAFTSRLISNADSLIACSQYLLDRTIHAVGGLNTATPSVIYGGVRSIWTDRETEAANDKTKYFLAVGSLRDVKGMDILIRAVARMDNIYSDYKLNIVGDGKLRQYLEELVTELGLENRISFHGQLDHTSLRDLYEGCLFCVIPSRDEGLSLVALESQANCRAVIASCVGGLPELIEDGVNGLLFEAENEQQLCEAIVHLIENPDLAKAMGCQGRQQVSANFTWDKNIERYNKLFGELID